MKKNKKLSLESLKVKSFVTDMSAEHKNTAKGGQYTVYCVAGETDENDCETDTWYASWIRC
ncbi:MAG: pinensin family lanthipeptide [Bacteroidota bacterium]